MKHFMHLSTQVKVRAVHWNSQLTLSPAIFNDNEFNNLIIFNPYNILSFLIEWTKQQYPTLTGLLIIIFPESPP